MLKAFDYLMGMSDETAVIRFPLFQFVTVCYVIMAALKLGDATSLTGMLHGLPEKGKRKHSGSVVSPHRSWRCAGVVPPDLRFSRRVRPIVAYCLCGKGKYADTVDKLFYKMRIILEYLQTIPGIS